ncbi:MAG TPA: serine/threonine-protein kinase, partial [Acidimicrobiales bacterium]
MTASSEPDRLLAGRYLVGPVVGRGRSPVYRARDMQLGREVAVKQVGLPGGPEGGVGSTAGTTRARALREARAAACLSSPSVVQVYDVVEEASAVWLVMELVQAPTLAQLVHDRGPLDEPLAARIGLGVLDALEDAHAHGVVHRDVKPANVLVGGLDDSGPDVAVKLADFGVAVVRDEPSVTAPGTVIGSPWYLAPEQATGRPAG